MMYTKLVLGLGFSAIGFISQHKTAKSRRPQIITRSRLVFLAGVLPMLGLAWVFYEEPYVLFEKLVELMFALGFSLFTSETIKNAVVRMRPYALGQGQNELTPDAYRSFPSAHAALATAGLMYLVQYLPPELHLLPTSVALFICYTRVVDKMHYVSDVVVGSLIGICGILLSRC